MDSNPPSFESEPVQLNPNESDPICAFTVDVEDWYQSCIDFDAPISHRVKDNVQALLEVLDARSVKGTFFVQGMVAEKFPSLMQQLVSEGHEIQSHGYSHRPLHHMNKVELLGELDSAKKSVEDACGVEVTAFRAPDFTIMHDNLWNLEVVAETGFRVDSSIFPMRTRRYGIDDWSLAPQKLVFPGGAEILEVPVAVLNRGKYRIPVAGGGYFRLFPFWFLTWAFRDIIDRRRPVIFYCHPYEFSSTELAQYKNKAPHLFRLQQSIGRKTFAKRIDKLLTKFRFGRFDQALRAWNVT